VAALVLGVCCRGEAAGSWVWSWVFFAVWMLAGGRVIVRLHASILLLLLLWRARHGISLGGGGGLYATCSWIRATAVSAVARSVAVWVVGLFAEIRVKSLYCLVL
jgi:hypothetical protein